jgi:hypothetical protein
MSLDEYHGHSQVTLTGQPGRSTGLERLGFFGDTRAAPQVGPWTALTMGRITSRADNCAIVPLDLRASDRRCLWMDIEAPRQPAAGVMSRPLHG